MTKPESIALGTSVQWRTQDVIVFALPTQSHMGVSVKLAEPTRTALKIYPSYTELRIHIDQPAPDAMVATALSNPCVITAVTKQAWHELRVQDDTDSAKTWWVGNPQSGHP